MRRSTGIVAVLAALITLGQTGEAQAQERAKLTGEASCIDADGKYGITWTLTLVLGEQETATAETEAGDFEGLDLIGMPQHEGYPFQAEAGNIFTPVNGRLGNGGNVARTLMDTKVYDPDTLQAMGRILIGGAPTNVEVTVYRPAVCTV